MSGRKLEVVTTGGRALRRPMTLTEAADSGDRRDLLAAMRYRISKTMEDLSTPPRDLAALARRLMEIANEIDVMDEREEVEASKSFPPPRKSFDPEAI